MRESSREPARWAIALAALAALAGGGWLVIAAVLVLGGVALGRWGRALPSERCALAIGMVPAALPIAIATVAAESLSLGEERSMEGLALAVTLLGVVPLLLAGVVSAGA